MLSKEYMMSRKWDKIATEEFEAMDSSARQDWAELRKRVAGS
jgi:hypothetical protein